MIPIIGALLGTLAESGLGLLSSAIQAKGKEVVENTLGVKIPDNPTPADVEKLRELQYQHEERLIELGIEKAKLEMAEMEMLAKAAQADAENITDRWKADMSSDSWLSKNIRPICLLAILLAYFIFTTMSAFGDNANEGYVNLLAGWGQLVMGAYFAGRTAEKIMEMRKK